MAEKSLNELPRDLRMLHTKGSDALSRENYDYAIDLFNQILTREPALYEVRKALRTAQLRKAGGGGGMFKKMWSNASSSPQVAKAQLALRNSAPEALLIAEQVLNSDPQNSAAHRIVIEASTQMQMPRTAVMSLEILAGNSPKDREVAIKLAYSLADSGEIVRAEQILSDLHDSFPADQDLSLALKNISARKTMEKGGYDALADGKGSYRDILKDKEEAVSLEQENRQVKSEDVTLKLIADYETRLKSEPTNLKLLRNLAELYTQKKQFDRALSYYEQIRATEGGNDPSLDRGIADTMLRKLEQQIAELDSTAPDFPERAAKLQAEKQAYQLAECQKRVERFPTDLQIRFELGQLYFDAGKIPEAIKEFQMAQANPNRKTKAMNFLGQCYARRNMDGLAVRTFEGALKEKLVIDDEKKEILYNLGTVLQKMGKRTEANKQFEDIYAVDISYKDVQKKVDDFYNEQSGSATS